MRHNNQAVRADQYSNHHDNESAEIDGWIDTFTNGKVVVMPVIITFRHVTAVALGVWSELIGSSTGF